jgi:hypothetical protein
VEVFQIALDMEIALACAVVDHQTAQRMHAFLDPVEGILEPGALRGIF